MVRFGCVNIVWDGVLCLLMDSRAYALGVLWVHFIRLCVMEKFMVVFGFHLLRWKFHGLAAVLTVTRMVEAPLWHCKDNGHSLGFC